MKLNLLIDFQINFLFFLNNIYNSSEVIDSYFLTSNSYLINYFKNPLFGLIIYFLKNKFTSFF